MTASEVTDVARPNPPDSHAPSGFWVAFRWASPRPTARSADGAAGPGAGRSWARTGAAQSASSRAERTAGWLGFRLRNPRPGGAGLTGVPKTEPQPPDDPPSST